MRIANAEGRLTIVADDDTLVDVERYSEGRFTSDPQSIYEYWEEFVDWARSVPLRGGAPMSAQGLRAVVPAPRQVFAIGLNYRDHAAESGFDIPDEPVVFTKYVSSFTGPAGSIRLSNGGVDWEVELVAVIGREARDVSADAAWEVVAGLTIGQDISDRTQQFSTPAAQFGLSKSHCGYSPIGPWLVTPDQFADPDDIALGCRVNGTDVQNGRTSDMIFGVAELVARLSRTVALYPGDVIFTGTPAGVGMAQDPPRYLRPGDRLHSWITGIGEMNHTFIGATDNASRRPTKGDVDE
jgi:2-keto-4-pentenoate hydratase/2-oxohepta-3-ene-1,7-dioic acid hydratase in catechol pathway